MDHSGEKTIFVRAPWEIIPDKLIVYRLDFLLRRGARVPLGTRTGPTRLQTASTALRGRRPGDPGGTGDTAYRYNELRKSRKSLE
jgi:hypothetical protein